MKEASGTKCMATCGESSAWYQVTTKIRMLSVEVVAISCHLWQDTLQISSNHLWFHVHSLHLQTNLKQAETGRLQGVFIASCLVYEQQGWRASRIKKDTESHRAHWQIGLVGQCHCRVWICLNSTFEDWDVSTFPASLYPIYTHQSSTHPTKVAVQKISLRIADFYQAIEAILEAIYTDSTHPETLCATPGQPLAVLGHPSPPERDPTKTSDNWICWSSLHPRRNKNTESWRGVPQKLVGFEIWNSIGIFSGFSFCIRQDGIFFRSTWRIRFRWRPGGWYCISEWIDPRLNHLTLPYPATSWMSRWKLGSMVIGSMGYFFHLLIHGLYWGYK